MPYKSIMKRCYILAVLAVAFLAIGEAVGTSGYRNRKLAENRSQRLLRTAGTTTDDATDEERGFQAILLGRLSNLAAKARLPKTAKNLQFRAWLKAKWDPNRLYEHFGFTGKELAVIRKDYDVWLEYSKIWLAKGGRYMT
ncbi:hypothetical protein PI125_g26745 [Phytophthora idaei]|nr:hypothetical protein PI125_g26745 [Phytophthora idaei]